MWNVVDGIGLAVKVGSAGSCMWAIGTDGSCMWAIVMEGDSLRKVMELAIIVFGLTDEKSLCRTIVIERESLWKVVELTAFGIVLAVKVGSTGSCALDLSR